MQKTRAINEQFKMKRKLEKESDANIARLDEDNVMSLVLEVFPQHSVLVFCDSKKNAKWTVLSILKRVNELYELGD